MGWFSRNKKKSGPDYSNITSREIAETMANRGELVRMLLVSSDFGGEFRQENMIYVPPFVAEIKQDTDDNVIRPMVVAGKSISYRVEPEYVGNSFVPVAITILASEPEAGQFHSHIKIWGEALEGDSAK